VVDVRDPDEFAAWSISGAQNIPLTELGSRMSEIDTQRDVVVVCASGGRSNSAAEMLSAAGITALDLIGGMGAWASVYDTAIVDLGVAQIVQVRRRGKGCLSYVVGAGSEAFVVDPSLETARYLDEAALRGWRITRVFDTHLHADHVSGARALAAATGASLHLNPADSFEFDFEPLTDGQYFELGGNIHFGVSAFATPGHTKGSTVFEIGGRAVLTGDTLFIDGVGRPDLAERAEEFARDLYRSLHAKVLALPTEALVLPAHYGDAIDIRPGEPVAATLGGLRRSLAQLGWDEEAFVTWASSRAAPRPPNYAEIIRVNMGRDHLDTDESHRLELGPNRCAA
jgi:glyoxylase-like metal-dependent hydrolase (beta-lactamase superfamily II)